MQVVGECWSFLHKGTREGCMYPPGGVEAESTFRQEAPREGTIAPALRMRLGRRAIESREGGGMETKVAPPMRDETS